MYMIYIQPTVTHKALEILLLHLSLRPDKKKLDPFYSFFTLDSIKHYF